MASIAETCGRKNFIFLIHIVSVQIVGFWYKKNDDRLFILLTLENVSHFSLKSISYREILLNYRYR